MHALECPSSQSGMSIKQYYGINRAKTDVTMCLFFYWSPRFSNWVRVYIVLVYYRTNNAWDIHKYLFMCMSGCRDLM
jgi:hypothetical protein